MRTITTLLTLLFVNLLHAAEPLRIVSLAPSITKSLYHLGASENIVGRTSYCFIADEDNKEIVASAVSVNVEKLITLKPDLVLATMITSPETLEIISKAGIKTVVSPTPQNFESLCEQFIELGTLVNRKNVADSIVKHTKREVAKIRDSYIKQPKQDFFFQIGAKPIFTVLDNTYMADYITLSGGRNIASGLKHGTLNREFVLTNNPDVIIIVNMGLVGEEEKAEWEKYPFLNAVKKKQVFFIESDMASTPNPQDFLRTMQVIQKSLQK